MANAKYSFLDKGLKKKYDLYYKLFMVCVLLGVVFEFVLSSKHDIMGFALPVVPYAGYIGYILGIVAIILLILQFTVKKADKRLTAETLRIIEQQEKENAVTK
jgi:hypothetical protein